MSKASRDKGARGEREAAEAWSKLTGRKYKRGRDQSAGAVSGRADIEPDRGSTGLWIEVKRGKAIAYQAAIEQAVEDCVDKSRVPVVFSRRDYRDWLITIQAKDLDDFVVAYLAERGEQMGWKQ